jgi:hypothetical protein
LDARTAALVAEYVRAEARLKSMVTESLLRGDFYTARVRREIHRQAQDLLLRLKTLGIPEAKRLVEDAYEAGVRVAGEQGHGTIRREAIDLLQTGLEERLTAATDTVGRRIDDIFRREGLRAAAMHASDEHDVAKLTAEMAERLRKEGVTGFVDKSGRNWGLENYADMAIRTTTTESQTQGTVHTLIARGFDLVEVHNSSGNPCDKCKPYVGKEFSLTGRASDVPLLDPAPPFHGRCNCFIAPSSRAAEERRLARAA